MKNAGQLMALTGCCVLLLFACGCGKAPHIKKLTAESVVLAFGDSLTAGEGAEFQQSYPAVLEKKLGCKVINAGLSGEVSARGLARLPGLLDEHKPDLVILCHGGNDLLTKRDTAQVAVNVEAMIKAIRDRGIDVVLIGVPKPGLALSTAGFYKDLARKHGIPCEADILSDILSSPSLKSDQIHPNAAGYEKLAEAIASLITASQ